MSQAFIELDRRFEEFSITDRPEDVAQKSYIAALLDQKVGIGWDELLQKKRLLVILGEPGSGKTCELAAQQAKFPKSSFFLRLNQLVNEEFLTILGGEELRQFTAWKNGNEDATFFLDAVDESKIQRDDDFVIALERVRNAIDQALPRARFVISSRISEWKSPVDNATVDKLLGETRQQQKESASDVFVVTILPLNFAQIRQFATASGVENPQDFMHALEEGNASAFAGRPLDVSHLYAYWAEKGHLGNLTVLTEFMIERLLREVPNKEKQDILSPEKARMGAEHLAAAVILCRNFRIQISDNALHDQAKLISPAQVLPESWLTAERRALIDRALFDGASHGSVSFHHRNHIEYLTASWIERLMSCNCGFAALEDLLFAKVDGQTTLRPYLAPIAAWLVTEGQETWRLRLISLLLVVAPEIHLAHGDPEALPIEYRRQVLRNLISRFQGRKLVRLDWDRPAMVRLAAPELAQDIIGYLLDKEISEDLRCDLLVLVRAGKLHECVPAALTIFADPETSDNLKIYAVTVVRDIGTHEHRQQLALAWPLLPDLTNRLLCRLCEALFAESIDVASLLKIIHRSHKVPRFSTDLQYTLKQLLTPDLDAEIAQRLLQEFLLLIKAPPLQSESPHISIKFYWVAQLLTMCLLHSFKATKKGSAYYELMTNGVLVLQYVERYAGANLAQIDKKEMQAILNHLDADQELRQCIFWNRMARCREKHGKEPEPHQLQSYDTLTIITKADLPWLLAAANGNLPRPDRLLALQLADNVLYSARSLPVAVWLLCRASIGDAKFLALSWQHLVFRLKAPFVRLWWKYITRKIFDKYWWRYHHSILSRYFHYLRDKWWLWRHLPGLSKGLYPDTLGNIVRHAKSKNSSQYGDSDWISVEKKWGKAVSSAIMQGCILTWKHSSPRFPHEQNDRFSTDLRTIAGLVGLQTMWKQGSLDFASLSTQEVEIIVRHACNELNGFPDWFADLWAKRPSETGKVLELAIAGEWLYSTEQEHVYDVTARLVGEKNRVIAISEWLIVFLQRADPAHPKILEYALNIITLGERRIADQLATIAPTRIQNYGQKHQSWLTWLHVWMQVDALAAMNYLDAILATKSAEEADELVLLLCSALSGRDRDHMQMNTPSCLSTAALKRLIPLVYRHIRIADDIDRAGGGVYSPGPRDYAQRFRSQLMSILAANPGAEPDAVLRFLFTLPELERERDWILHLIDQRKRQRADAAPWAAQDIRHFAERFCNEPRSDAGLFQLTCRLINNIKNDIECSENASNRKQVRIDDREKDLQGFLARELNERSLKWFSVTQESEVDLAQRPDLRIERPTLNPLPVEVKLANLNHWPIHKLLERLENQLIGQYLRAANVSFGIYILGNTDPKRKWEVPGTRAMINFSELVAHIQDSAKRIQASLPAGVDGIEVIGIDFSDPKSRTLS